MSIQREDLRPGIQFGHSHQTGVGERHGDIGVLSHQVPHVTQVLLKIQIQLQNASLDQLHGPVVALTVPAKDEQRLR